MHCGVFSLPPSGRREGLSWVKFQIFGQNCYSLEKHRCHKPLLKQVCSRQSHNSYIVYLCSHGSVVTLAA